MSEFVGSQMKGIVPTPSGKSDWGGTRNGYNVGGETKKAAEGKWDEVTTVKVGSGDPGIDGHASAEGISGKSTRDALSINLSK